MRQDRLRGMEAYVHSITVGRGFRDKLRGNRSPASSAVLDNGCLSDLVQPLRQCPRGDIGDAARRGRHDDPDRLRWIALRKRG